jgi:hypothetical protein
MGLKQFFLSLLGKESPPKNGEAQATGHDVLRLVGRRVLEEEGKYNKYKKELFDFEVEGETVPIIRNSYEFRASYELLHNDEYFEENSDVLTGYVFLANLILRTPLCVLRHHGEFHKGPPSKLPSIGSQGDGMWIHKTRTWRSLGVDIDEMKPCMSSSSVGPVDSSKFLPFLISFREIVESSSLVFDKIKAINDLCCSNELYSEYAKTLKNNISDFPESFFYNKLTEIPGVGLKTAKVLFEKGFYTIDDIKSADVNLILEIPGIGKSVVHKMQAYFKMKDGL